MISTKILYPCSDFYHESIIFAQETYAERHAIDISPTPDFVSIAIEDEVFIGFIAGYFAHAEKPLFSETLMNSKQRTYLDQRVGGRLNICEIGTRCISQTSSISSLHLSCLLTSHMILEAHRSGVPYLLLTSNRTVKRIVSMMDSSVEEIGVMHQHEGNKNIIKEWYSIFKARHYFFLVDVQRNAANAEKSIASLTRELKE